MTYMLTRTRPADLREGDMIDLAKLPFADEYGPNDIVHYEYGEVWHTEREVADGSHPEAPKGQVAWLVETSIGAFAVYPDYELARMVPLS